MTIVARKDFEPKTLEELVAYVKDNTDKVTLANAGVGAASQLCGLLIEQAMGVDLTEVPYDGTGPALTDLVGGQVDFMCDQTTNTAGQIQSGEIKGYAVTTPERVEALPDLPTTADAGIPDVKVGVWHGLYVPADTPDEVIEKLTEALLDETERSLPCAPKVLEVISTSALRVTPHHLLELEARGVVTRDSACSSSSAR